MPNAATRSTGQGAGELTERLTIQSTTPVAVAVTSITRVGAVATATAPAPHGFTDGDYVTLAGAAQAGYNVSDTPIGVTGANTFTFAVDGATVTPATGTITAVFNSDAAGGTPNGWYALATVWGVVTPLSAAEILARGLSAIEALQNYWIKLYYRGDLTPKQRVLWSPYLMPTKTLEIHGVLPDVDEPRRFVRLDVGEIVA